MPMVDSIVPLVNLPLSVYLHIGLFSRRAERLFLLQLTRQLYFALRHLLYRNIEVGAAAAKVVHSLACNVQLRPMVQSLQFSDPSASIPPRLWTLVFPTLENLEVLSIAYDIPLPGPALSYVTFRLTALECFSNVTHEWMDLIRSQPGLEELILRSSFTGDAPNPYQLPRLRRICAGPTEVSKFARLHDLQDVWFLHDTTIGSGRPSLSSSDLRNFSVSPSRLCTLRISTPDFLRLVDVAPNVVSMLIHLALDEDMTWSDFLLKSNTGGLVASTFGQAATALDRRFFYLRSIVLVCSQSIENRHHRPLLVCKNAKCFATVLAGNCTAVKLEAFRFYASDGYAIWTDWGGEREELAYWDTKDADEISFESEYANFF
ncbi:hypothetical protein C8R45DRAFT_1089410 [Mycena sanguinolenta]|nr:hypothetical protein C8R45DRAFT_1089410 [Mycena sanguinolenta]